MANRKKGGENKTHAIVSLRGLSLIFQAASPNRARQSIVPYDESVNEGISSTEQSAARAAGAIAKAKARQRSSGGGCLGAR